PSRIVAWTLRLAIFPLGIHYNKPSDANLQAVAKSMMEPGVTRDRHTFLCYWKDDANDMTGHMELAFLAMREHAEVYKRIRKAVKLGDIAEDLSGDELV